MTVQTAQPVIAPAPSLAELLAAHDAGASLRTPLLREPALEVADPAGSVEADEAVEAAPPAAVAPAVQAVVLPPTASPAAAPAPPQVVPTLAAVPAPAPSTVEPPEAAEPRGDAVSALLREIADLTSTVDHARAEADAATARLQAVLARAEAVLPDAVRPATARTTTVDEPALPAPTALRR